MWSFSSSNQAYCDATVFSLMARYYGGALACNCGILGSNLTQPCETFGGQCSCKPGVGGRQCDVCLPGYFRLTNTGCEGKRWRACPGGRFKNTYELLSLRALKISMLYKNRTFQCMGKIFCVEFQRVPLKFHTNILPIH